MWTGATSSDWYTTTNWNPANVVDATTETAEFGTDAGTVANQPTTARNTTATQWVIGGVTFTGAGWTISPGNNTTPAPVGIRMGGGGTDGWSSAGAGVNLVNATVQLGNGGSTLQTISVDTGNTLVFGGGSKFTIQQQKTGAGTVVFQGTTPATLSTQQGLNVTAGTALINTATGYKTDTAKVDGDWIVSGGVLGGTGTIKLGDQYISISDIGFGPQDVIIQSGGTLNPGGNGDYGALIGTLTVSAVDNHPDDRDSSVYIQSGGKLAVNVSKSSMTADLLAISSTVAGNNVLDLSAGGGILDILADGSFAVNDRFTIATYDGLVGSFGSILANDAATSNWTVDTSVPTKLDIVYVPEPASLAGLGIGAVALLARRRRV